MFLLKDKAETFEKLVHFCAMVKTQFGVVVQRVGSNHGTEFIDKRFQNFFIENCIIHETSCVDTPQQNG